MTYPGLRLAVTRSALASMLLCGWLALSGCAHREAVSQSSTPEGVGTFRPATARTFACRGDVIEVSTDGMRLRLRHDSIPGFMPAMVMEFRVRDGMPSAIVVPGDRISFRLHVSAERSAIDEIHILSHSAGAAPSKGTPPVAGNVALALARGEPFPDFEFLGEDGRSHRFSELRGTAVAITLFFSRCPVPEFCPLMNRQFARARERLATGSISGKPPLLLSLSFDEENDTPGALTRYARPYRGRESRGWQFGSVSTAVVDAWATQIDFHLNRERGAWMHNLRTVVVDRDGRLARRFDGNAWTEEELVEALVEASKR